MGRADIYSEYDQTLADYSTFDRKIALDSFRMDIGSMGGKGLMNTNSRRRSNGMANEHLNLGVRSSDQPPARRSRAAANVICAVAGVDGVFFGPADLAASMGMIGQSTDAAVQRIIDEGIQTTVESGKAAGVLTTDPALAKKHLQLGATFVAVGVDTSLLVRAATDLAASFKA